MTIYDVIAHVTNVAGAHKKMAASVLIQITNISSFVSPQQVKELMSYLGDIVELRVFPERYIIVTCTGYDGCMSRVQMKGVE